MSTTTFLALFVCAQLGWQATSDRQPAGATTRTTTLVASDFGGTAPAANVPWKKTAVLASGVSFGGWDLASGAIPEPGVDDALGFSINAPAGALSTLAQAIVQDEYATCTVGPAGGGTLDLDGVQMSFSVQRLSWRPSRRTRTSARTS